MQSIRLLEKITGIDIVDPTTPCYRTAKSEFEKTQQAGKGGTLLFAFNSRLDGGGHHTTFVPDKTPEMLKKGPFCATEAYNSEASVSKDYPDLEGYQDFWEREVVALCASPNDNFERVFRDAYSHFTGTIIRSACREAWEETVEEWKQKLRLTKT